MISPWLKGIEPGCLAWALLGATEEIRLPFGFFLTMMRRFLFVIFLFLPNVGYAFPHTNERVIDYTLQVSFNLQASKMNGIATILIKAGEQMNPLPGLKPRVSGLLI
jgi:hypothetical protein